MAAHYPDKCIAAAGLCVPYGVLELGLEELLKTVDRDVYPETEYPWGQWSYMNFYETNAEKASDFFDADIRGVLRALRMKADPSIYGKPAAVTANVTRDSGWMGGVEKPDPKWRDIPVDNIVLDEEAFEDLTSAMEKTGFWTADAWYLNHKRNRTYSLEKWKNSGVLDMPVLFVHAKYDVVCATTNNVKICENMRQKCPNLKECVVESSHWVAEEKPVEVNGAIARWLAEECKDLWPTTWVDDTTVGK